VRGKVSSLKQATRPRRHEVDRVHELCDLASPVSVRTEALVLPELALMPFGVGDLVGDHDRQLARPFGMLVDALDEMTQDDFVRRVGSRVAGLLAINVHAPQDDRDRV
jgi:hypothetical protein